MGRMKPTGASRPEAEADDLYGSRYDPDEWDEQPVQIEVRPTGSEMVSFRLPADELDRVVEAAESTGESLSQFVRGALRDRLEPSGQALARTVTSGPLARYVRTGPLVSGVHVHPGTVSAYVVRDQTGERPRSVTSCEGAVAAG